MKKIYIAGPDVFEENSLEIGKTYANICSKYGFEGLYPLDNLIDFSQPKKKIARDIFEANVALIKEADIIIANLNAFRGKEADSGTVWECGYGFGLGKKVYGYMHNTRSYVDNFTSDERTFDNDVYLDNDGRLIEDFDYPINLMIACSALEIIEGGFEDVVRQIKG